MKKIAILVFFTVGFFVHVWACTGLIAGKQATVDGSVLVTYSADSHTLYGALTSSPAADWPKGSMRSIVEWDTNKPLGEIEQVEHTYAVMGNMNEHQLTVVESTWGGRPELVDTTGIIDYGSLMQLALERAKTAREAIKVMTGLVKKYGYYSSGESFTIADPNEAWILDLIGKGPGRRGAVWVAVRIPDDCIAGHANYPRIHKIPMDDKENCLYSPDVISFAREMGYFDGLNKDFSFARAYSPADFGALRACDARVWSFFRKYDSSMDNYLPYVNGESAEPFPLYVKPSRKLSVQDMKEAMRDHFEDTPFDMTQDVGAGPFKVPYRFRPMSFEVDGKSYCMERAIATQQTGFTLVGQMRNWLPDPVGGVLWFGVDDANTCVYIPMYCGITQVPECFSPENGSMYDFSWTSAFWIHNWVANMAYARYEPMIGDIRKVQSAVETSLNLRQPAVDKAAVELYATSPQEAIAYLTQYSCDAAEASTARWKKLGEYLMVKFLDGNVKQEENGNSRIMVMDCPILHFSPDIPKSTMKKSCGRRAIAFSKRLRSIESCRELFGGVR